MLTSSSEAEGYNAPVRRALAPVFDRQLLLTGPEIKHQVMKTFPELPCSAASPTNIDPDLVMLPMMQSFYPFWFMCMCLCVQMNAVAGKPEKSSTSPRMELKVVVSRHLCELNSGPLQEQ